MSPYRLLSFDTNLLQQKAEGPFEKSTHDSKEGEGVSPTEPGGLFNSPE
jgi:hypothetical protein